MAENENGRKKYFAALNSGEGFVSFFDENLRAPRAERCFIIQGGPGTGKSRLIDETAAAAEAAGGETELYFCSSDPDSLDGLFVRMPGGGSFSVIDGTAPHTADLRSPGVSDFLIDLGRFLDASVLRARAGEIGQMTDGKRKAYGRAYRCLSAAASLGRAADELILGCTDLDAVGAEAQKIAGLSDGEARETLRSPLGAWGMRGYTEFDTFAEQADRVFEVTDQRGLGNAYLLLGAAAKAAGRCRIAPDPLFPERISAFLCGGLAVTAKKEGTAGGEGTDMARFLNENAFRRIREEYSALRRLSARSLTAASVALSAAARYHFALERIYADAMDFAGKEQFTREFCGNVLLRGLYG